MKRLLLSFFMMWAMIGQAQVLLKVGNTVIDSTEVKSLDGVTTNIQTQLNNKFDKSATVSATSVFYTKAQIDSILVARFGNLRLTGSKLSYVAGIYKYTAKTDSTLNLGPELVTNGSFANGTGWNNVNSFATFTGGVAQVNTVTSTFNDIINQTIAIVNGKTYKVDVSVTAYTSGQLAIGLGNWDGVRSTAITATGNYSFILTANQTTPLRVSIVVLASPFVGSIDNISVKEVL